MRPQALLFDLDGTLVDSHHEICLALDKALRELGHLLERDVVHALVDGTPLEVIWEKLHVGTTPPPIERFVHAYRSHYMCDLGHATSLFPEVVETLSVLRARLPDARMAVVSNKGALSVAPLLERMALAPHFTLALGAGGTALRPKPEPDLLLHAARELGCAPEACVMIGDTVYDIEAGRRAGMTTIAISHGMGPRAQLLEARADHVIDSFAQLLDVLG